jgi:hypothetical protein
MCHHWSVSQRNNLKILQNGEISKVLDFSVVHFKPREGGKPTNDGIGFLLRITSWTASKGTQAHEFRDRFRPFRTPPKVLHRKEIPKEAAFISVDLSQMWDFAVGTRKKRLIET